MITNYKREIEEILISFQLASHTEPNRSLTNQLLALIKKAQEDLIKKVDQEMLDRIAYIGEEIPEYFVTDNRPKFILLGYPQEMLDSLIDEKDSK